VRIVILDLKWSYGIEVLTRQVARQLRKRAEVTVISAERPQCADGVRVARQDNYCELVLAFFNPLVYLRLLRRIRRVDPQVIYIISPHVLNVPVVLLCKWFTRAIVISHIHDPAHSGGLVVDTIVDLVSRMQSKWSDRVYCWGKAIQDAIARKFHVPASRIAIFRHGPGHPTPGDTVESMAAKPSPKYFSQIGTIMDRKGIEYFLEAARLFNEKHGAEAAQFLLAGTGSLEKYQPQMERLPNLVVHNRFLEDAEVNDILASSYASVLPYTEGVMQSSFIAIAYGNGCPVIVSDIGSLPEGVEVGKTGFVVERKNAEQIAEAMTKIYTGNSKAFSANCLKFYREKFSWESLGEEFYRDMANSVALRNGAVLEERQS